MVCCSKVKKREMWWEKNREERESPPVSYTCFPLLLRQGDEAIGGGA